MLYVTSCRQKLCSVRSQHWDDDDDDTIGLSKVQPAASGFEAIFLSQTWPRPAAASPACVPLPDPVCVHADSWEEVSPHIVQHRNTCGSRGNCPTIHRCRHKVLSSFMWLTERYDLFGYASVFFFVSRPEMIQTTFSCPCRETTHAHCQSYGCKQKLLQISAVWAKSHKDNKSKGWSWYVQIWSWFVSPRFGKQWICSFRVQEKREN